MGRSCFHCHNTLVMWQKISPFVVKNALRGFGTIKHVFRDFTHIFNCFAVNSSQACQRDLHTRWRVTTSPKRIGDQVFLVETHFKNVPITYGQCFTWSRPKFLTCSWRFSSLSPSLLCYRCCTGAHFSLSL